MPAEATRGLLCGTCAGTLTYALVTAGDLVVHVRSSVHPGAVAKEHVQKEGTGMAGHAKAPTPPVPADLDAIDAADLIYATLVGWTETVAPSLRLHGPERQPAWRTNGSHGEVVGLVAGSTGEEAEPYASWLEIHLDKITEQSYVAEMVGDEHLTGIIEQIDRRWPRQDRTTKVTDLRCPIYECQMKDLRRHPPAGAGAVIIYSCHHCRSNTAGPDDETIRRLITEDNQRNADRAEREAIAKTAAEARAKKETAA
jgi:hypothetical protein